MFVMPTKLHIPPPPPQCVVRPALFERLDGAVQRPLTLLAAPAGYGKTTLLAAWLAARLQATGSQRRLVLSSVDEGAALLPAPSFAWLSLDADDNDPVRFLSGLVAALQTVAPSVGTAALAVLQASPGLDNHSASALALLIADLLTAAPVVLVLDDTHVLEAPAVTSLLRTLVERQPPTLRLVLAGRADPPLPLARLRARGHMSEIRAADLRFTPADAAAFLRTTLRLDLQAATIARLVQRTEGWPAGLQLAALALQQTGDPDSDSLVHTGRHRFLLDYFADEVLAQQPTEVQNFLLSTALLERMCAPLCDAMLDAPSADRRTAASILDQIERANLFLTPLDPDRRWFRYHHLFADLLRYRLQQRYPERIPLLQRRAATWFAEQGLVDEAIRHAAAAGADDLLAQLVEGAGRARLARGELATLQQWLAALPPAQIIARPRLLLLQIWTHVWAYQPVEVERLLRILNGDAGTLDAALQAEILALQAFVARSRDDQAAALRLGREALALAEADAWLHGFVHGGMGDLAWFAGDVLEAMACQRCALAAACRSGDLVQLVDATHSLAQFELLQGRLTAAEAAYRYGDQVLAGCGASAQPFRDLLALSHAGILYERYELAEARTAAELGLAWAARCGLSVYEPFAQIELARISAAQGDLVAARQALVALEQAIQQLRSRMHGEPPVWFETLHLRQVEIWASLNDTLALARWVGKYWAPPDPDAPPGALIRQLACALALVAGRDRPQAFAAVTERQHTPLPTLAAQMIASCRQRFAAWGLGAVVLEVETLTAVLHAHCGEIELAQAALQRALELAAPEGFVRPFVSRGPAMGALCRAALEQNDAPAQTTFLHRLLQTFPSVSPGYPVTRSPRHVLIEALTPREREIIPLLAAGLSHRAIAAQLQIAPDTARTHIKNIYGKLQVQNRVQAVERARGLQIIS